MSYCESCGRGLRAGASFCSSCGSRIQAVAPAPHGVVPAASRAAGQGAGYPAAMSAAGQDAGVSAGCWLVVVGGLLVFVMSFVYWSAYSVNYGSGWSSWYWQHSVAASSWRGLWPPYFFAGAWWGEWRGLVGQGLYAAQMVTTVLCVIAVIQAMRRGLAGAAVSGSALRSIGVATAAVVIAQQLYWVTYPTSRSLDASGMVALLGAVLIIVGGTKLGPSRA